MEEIFYNDDIVAVKSEQKKRHRIITVLKNECFELVKIKDKPYSDEKIQKQMCHISELSLLKRGKRTRFLDSLLVD